MVIGTVRTTSPATYEAFTDHLTLQIFTFGLSAASMIGMSFLHQLIRILWLI